MANDRISIKCKTCGAEYVIVRYYPGNIVPAIEDAETFGEFLIDHLESHHPYGFSQDLHGDPGFVIETESST
jgi:hypothetical protein